MRNRVFAIAVAVATSAFFCSQAVRAQSLANASDPNNQSAMAAAAHREAAEMVPATAVLTQQIDARKTHPGQQFRARLTETVHLKDGNVLPKDTNLVGTVAKDKMNPDGTSTLALRFTAADTKNGKDVPIVATIIGVAPPLNGSGWDASDSPRPDPWDGTTLRVDEIGAVSGFDLHSSIAGPNSGVLVSKKKDEVKLADQTQLSLAIAAQGAGSESGGA